MKPLKIGVWYIFLALVLCPVIYFRTPYFPLSLFPKDSWEWQLLEFEHRLKNFQSDTGPRKVILGPSYAQEIGEPGKVHNLGFIALGPPEIESIAKQYCKPTDQIYLFCSVGDIGYLKQNVEPRRIFTSTFLRRLTIAKARITGLSSPGVFVENVRHKHSDSMKILKPADLDFVWYEHMRERYNIALFVLNPYNIPNQKTEDVYRSTMKARFKTLDLSESVSPEMMRDICHLTTDGLAIARMEFMKTTL